jgi:4-aminobutyrate---pyruvate transaminase
VVQDECQKAGLIVRAIGDRIAFTPPLVITRSEIEEMLARFRTALDAATPRLMPA